MNAAGEQREACETRMAELGIGNAVEFLADIPSWNELPAVYARSDILLLPANFSNGNFTILEAMASGMGLVISDRVLGIGKMVNDGINGFNCEPTAQAFLDRIERYVANPRLFKEHAEINRRLAQPLSVRGTASFLAQLIERRLEEQRR
jgi:glycosyltransferase involved in cell wall biosynthesis